MFRFHHTSVWLALLTLLLLSLPAVADAQVPFKANVHGFTVSQMPDPTDPTLLIIVVDLKGTGTHLGRFDEHLTHFFNPTTLAFTGFAVFTAANGDTFTTHFFGQGYTTDDPDWITFAVTHTIVEGTGRFKGASGSFVGVGGRYNLVTGEDMAGYVGTISIPGSNKK
jgi:hypothetical protein